MVEPIQMKELETALEKISPYTAPGASGIPSEIWKSANDAQKNGSYLQFHFWSKIKII